jgi:hypothetical protein
MILGSTVAEIFARQRTFESPCIHQRCIKRDRFAISLCTFFSFYGVGGLINSGIGTFNRIKYAGFLENHLLPKAEE